MMVRLPMAGVSRALKAAGSKPLDDEEREEGVFAFSAMLYEEGAEISARALVALWVVGVTVPRVADYLEERSEKRKKLTAGDVESIRKAEAQRPPTPVAVTG